MPIHLTAGAVLTCEDRAGSSPGPYRHERGGVMNKTMAAVVVAGTTNLDSAGVVELLVAIEEEFSVSIDFVTVDPASLLTIEGLTRYLSTLEQVS